MRAYNLKFQLSGVVQQHTYGVVENITWALLEI